MGLEPCKMYLDVWLRPHVEDHYEYIAVCVDDLLIAFKDYNSARDVLANKHSFKLKGTGPIFYYIGRDFGRDDDGTLHLHPKSTQRQ